MEMAENLQFTINFNPSCACNNIFVLLFRSDEKTLYHCSVCGKVFMSKWSLIRHFRNVHSDDKKVLKVKKEDVEVKEEISEEPC